MERRRKKRFSRRLQINYWLAGDDQIRSSYTTNVSIQGAFVATNAPSAPGTRLRLEFTGDQGFIVESVVTHAARVSTSLQSIRASGMGIRFLSASELVSTMLPFHSEETEPIPGSDSAASDTDRTSEGSTRSRASKRSDSQVYTVGFRNVGYLLNTIEEEIRFGGVFVATDSPAGLQEDVRVALALPAPIKRTIYVDAVVVTLSDPGAAHSESTLRGMGVALKDTTAVLRELNQLIDAARPAKPPDPET